MKTAELKKTVEELEAYVEELEETLVYVRERKPSKAAAAAVLGRRGRMEQVLEILQRGKAVSVPAIAKELDIDPRNVSSQLSYLRAGKLGGVKYLIGTDYRGYKLLMS